MTSLTTFTPFPRLPTELQMQIWQEAIQQGDRFVLMFRRSLSIIPTHLSLCSPLLMTCSLSRTIYLEAYPVRVPVYDQNKGPGRSTSDMLFRMANLTHHFLPRPRDGALVPLCSGALYINPATDIFVFGAELEDPAWEPALLARSGRPVVPYPTSGPAATWTPRFFTLPLEPSIRGQVTRVLGINDMLSILDPSRRRPGRPIWDCACRQGFRHVTSCYHFNSCVNWKFTAWRNSPNTRFKHMEWATWEKLTRALLGRTTDMDIESRGMARTIIKHTTTEISGVYTCGRTW